MDLTNVSTEDLQAFQSGDLSKVSDAGLQILSAATASTPDPQGAKIDAYLSATDIQLGLPAGTSARQIQQESHFNPAAVNPNSGAAGLAQVMPATVQSLSNQVGRTLDPMNVDDALYMHRTLMQQNLTRFGSPAAALAAYNSGWVPLKWNNDETNNYVATILPSVVPAAPPAPDPTAYKPFADVIPKLPVAQLGTSKDWLNAGRQLFSWDERKAWVGTDADLADWLQTKMIWGANNIGSLSKDAAGLINHGTPDDARAYLYARDQWDAVQGNSGTKWHAVGAGTLDPLNVGGAIATVVGGIMTLGTGAAPIAAGDIAASQAAKAAVKLSLQKFITYKVGQAVGRAGIVGAGYGAIAGTTNSIANQSVSRRESEHRVLVLSKVRVVSTKRAAVTISRREDVQAQAPELMIESVLVPLMHPGKEPRAAVLIRRTGTLGRRDAEVPTESVGDGVEDGLEQGRQDGGHVGFRLEKPGLWP